MLSNQTILAALRDCYDPDVPLNVVDLGLVQRISLTPDPDAPGASIPGVPQKHLLALSLLATTDDEDKRSQLSAQIENRMAGLPEISHTTITFLSEPPWSPHLISPQGRRQLGLDQPQFPILNNRVR